MVIKFETFPCLREETEVLNCFTLQDTNQVSKWNLKQIVFPLHGNIEKHYILMKYQVFESIDRFLKCIFLIMDKKIHSILIDFPHSHP